MSAEKYFSRNHRRPLPFEAVPADALVNSVSMNGDDVDTTMCFHAFWLVKDGIIPGLVKHDSDEVLIFIGADRDNHEALNGTVTVQIENDELALTETCVVYVPKGKAHGNIRFTGLSKSVLCYTYQLTEAYYRCESAVPADPEGTYAHNAVFRYEPLSGIIPEAPEGFLTFLLWLDGQKLAGAPYMETVRFLTTNDTGPETHVHDFDELIGFLGGTPENPEELNGEITFYIDGETVSSKESCVIFIPKGVEHSPILVPENRKSFIHFSASNEGVYQR